MREKLVKLLKSKYDHYCDQCGINKQSDYIVNLADYLIANGVTFATDNNDGCKWIPVKQIFCFGSSRRMKHDTR